MLLFRLKARCRQKTTIGGNQETLFTPMSRINRKKTKVKTNSITSAGKTENVKAHSIHFMKWQKKDRDATTEPNCQKGK